jgi:CBS domain-containing membrane protein
MVNCNSLLSKLVVRDVMRPSVVTVPASAELGQAAALMQANLVNCLPVVDDQARCVGVLTATDFVSRFAERVSSTRPLAGDAMSLAESGLCRSLLLEESPPDYVRPRMSAAVQTVRADTPLRAAARLMSATGLHHLLVLDDSCRPAGVISSLDIVSALVSEPTETIAEEKFSNPTRKEAHLLR